MMSDLPFHDRADFADADHGFIGTLDPLTIKAADGRVVFDSTRYGFLAGDCPGTVSPSLVLALAVCAFTAAGHDSPPAIADWAAGCSQAALR
jgi:alkyl sulfatase BDS1-like metallo-beta-lactamase superfamily hydrolase